MQIRAGETQSRKHESEHKPDDLTHESAEVPEVKGIGSVDQAPQRTNLICRFVRDDSAVERIEIQLVCAIAYQEVSCLPAEHHSV
jgi:hypothetical protein